MKKSLHVIFIIWMVIFSDLVFAKSTCYGTTANGKLENAVQLPKSGDNFIGYSNFARYLGRTYVHSAVKDIMIESYQMLKDSMPDKVYKYAETGFKKGGRFKPHKTHQNGLSVDFMVPVMNQKGQSIHLPTHMMNRYGYDIEFNAHGLYEHFRIDFEAMAEHIWALHLVAQKKGYGLKRVIFDLKLQKHLFNTKKGKLLKKQVVFSKKKAWVRHDEHYHVDFDIPCKK